ncbi:MAG: P1 family peptidase, partial [Proteobacteria bacterium]|nr:P1 family peptidase [Pseudomonadota bacterium]
MKILGAGKRNHLTDVAGLLVGNAEDARLKSGVTVVTSRLSFACGVAVMGGAPGTRETDLLSPASLVEKVDALVLAGGSAYGLAAATGVMAGLAKAGHGLEVIAKASGVPRVPIVP